MEKLYFNTAFVAPILCGEKTSTWRIDEPVPYRRSNTHLMKSGDIIMLCDDAGENFAKAIITDTIQKKISELTAEDKEGHDTYGSDEEMYKAFSGYYNIVVTENTKIKVVKFTLLFEAKSDNL